MTLDRRIGVIGANGWLGGAIVGRLLECGTVGPDRMTLSWRKTPSTRFTDCHWTTDNQDLADRSDIVILAVRPQDWPGLGIDARGKLVVSVMAAITMGTLAAGLKSDRIVRTLPNAAADVGLSYTPWIASGAVTDEDRADVRSLLGACGEEDELPREDLLDYMTGLTGTGPAYPALLAAAMMADAVRRGLPPAIARRAVNTLLAGAGRMIEAAHSNPDETVRAFVDYRGVTAAGIEAMRAHGFEEAVRAGLAAALEKSEAMAASL